MADTVVRIVTHLLSFQAHLYRACSDVTDAALFVMKKRRGRHLKGEQGNQ
jgi:hypothetical protein